MVMIQVIVRSATCSCLLSEGCTLEIFKNEILFVKEIIVSASDVQESFEKGNNSNFLTCLQRGIQNTIFDEIKKQFSCRSPKGLIEKVHHRYIPHSKMRSPMILLHSH